MLHSFLEFVGQKIQVEDFTGKDPKDSPPPPIYESSKSTEGWSVVGTLQRLFY